MTKTLTQMKFWAMIIALFAGFTFASCGKEDEPGTGGEPVIPPTGELTELKSPITANTTLKDLGLDVDYFYAGTSPLEVKNNATLTIEPGVTIRFDKTGGGMDIKDGACIKAKGLPKLLDANGAVVTVVGVELDGHIKFIGAGSSKGSWDYIRIETNAENTFEYVDFINGGKRTGGAGVVELWGDGSQLNMSHCKISGGLAYGLYCTYLPGVIPTFKNNVIEGCVTPVYLNDVRQVVDFDMTSTYQNNTNNYVIIYDLALPALTNVTINRTSVPYFVEGDSDIRSTLTINEGVTFYMDSDAGLSLLYDNPSLIVNGTAENPVTFTRLPGTSYHWASSGAMGIQLWKGNHAINNCIIEYGGGRSGIGAISLAYETSLSLNNVIIRNSNHYGVYVSQGHTDVSITHTNVTFANNADGNVYWHDGNVYTQIP